MNVIGQEGSPGLGRWSPRPHKIFRDAGFTDLDAELQQLAVNARRAPRGVRLRHRADQRADLRGNCRRPIRGRLFHVQKRRKARRCHAMTVSGRTMTMADRHSAQVPDNHTQSSRSACVRWVDLAFTRQAYAPLPSILHHGCRPRCQLASPDSETAWQKTAINGPRRSLNGADAVYGRDRAPKTIIGELSVLRQVLRHAKLWYRFADDYRPLKNTKPPVARR